MRASEARPRLTAGVSSLRASTRAAGLALLCGSAVALGCGGSEERSDVDCDSFRFDAEAWDARDAARRRGDAPTVRQALADGLLACDLIEGRSAAWVRSQLGPSESSTTSTTFASYRLGPDRRSGGSVQIDSEFLSIEFGSNGRVVRATTLTP